MLQLKTMISTLLIAGKLSYNMTVNEVRAILLYQYNCGVTPRILEVIMAQLLLEDKEKEVNYVLHYPEQYYEGC